MPVTAVVGAQWGDEGKGRVIDFLAETADMVIRFQGGDNAGHTVVNDLGLFRLHLIPSGIFYPATRNIVGTGTVINPDNLLAEMQTLTAAGVDLANLWLSDRAHMIMPYHPLLDGLEETARGGTAIGTTKRGIGPTYSDKAARWGLRLGDLRHPAWLRQRLEQVVPRKNILLEHYGAPLLSVDALYEQCMAWQEALGPRIVDVAPMVRQAVQSAQNVLLEGQLGVMRDLDWGIYPYVTSSNPTAAFAGAGAGLPASKITRVVGVVKAYSTCVGAGPFPVELLDASGDELRELGDEYGATTGRPRRVGWFDGVAIDYAAWLNGMTDLVVTKLDVLDTLAELKVCTGYRLGDQVLTHVPDTAILEQVTPIYESWPGWQQPTTGCRHWDQLPAAAQRYLRRLEELAGVPITWVSVGAAREAMFAVQHR
ncbi:MAG TPA: adenylosuccinate synthase [Anaerolineae bacterium]|nr:adenylosuccinate synthase [Anaerolineae bacterium]HNU02622.1 adenylosuccinate synthase [Anaerolineae bacterium]